MKESANHLNKSIIIARDKDGYYRWNGKNKIKGWIPILLIKGDKEFYEKCMTEKLPVFEVIKDPDKKKKPKTNQLGF